MPFMILKTGKTQLTRLSIQQRDKLAAICYNHVVEDYYGDAEILAKEALQKAG